MVVDRPRCWIAPLLPLNILQSLQCPFRTLFAQGFSQRLQSGIGEEHFEGATKIIGMGQGAVGFDAVSRTPSPAML